MKQIMKEILLGEFSEGTSKILEEFSRVKRHLDVTTGDIEGMQEELDALTTAFRTYTGLVQGMFKDILERLPND